MILEFDAGNTRIKWRLRDTAAAGQDVVAQGAVFAQEKTPAVFLDLCKQFEGLPVHAIDKVLVASVRGESFKTAFSAFLSEKWQLQPAFVAVGKSSALLQHGYAEPGRLGVDRWLAMLAAYAVHRRQCVVIDFGTTVTVDIVSGRGAHLGGYIVPGLQLMKNSLTQRSRALQIEDQSWGSLAPGLNTSAAIHHGVLAMVTGFVRDLHAQYAGSAPDTVWILTGGDAGLIQPLLGWPTLLEPALVLDGLRYSQAS